MGGMVTAIETITPARAAQYLKHNTRNRRVRPKRVEVFKSIIRDGRWQCTHQGIAFNCDGSLLDGQHRLMAIAEAGAKVQVQVTRGLPKEAMYGIDQNLSLRDAADIAGPLDLDIGITRNHAALARAMSISVGSGPPLPTNQEVIDFILLHKDAIDFAYTVPLGHCNSAIFRAAIARAWYTEDHTRLAEFAEVLCNGLAEGKGDKAAIKLRDMYGRGKRGYYGSVGRVELFAKVEAAIRAFCERRPVDKLYAVEKECYPIPGDE